MSGDTPSLNHLLERQPENLRQLLERAEHLASIQRVLRECLNEPWADALRVANLHGPLLVLHADHAAAATALRHRHDELIGLLNQRMGLRLTRLELKVRPPPQLGAS